MIHKKLSIIFILLIISISTIYAQRPREFNDPENFMKEFKEFMERIKNDDLLKEVEIFEENVELGYIDQGYLIGIMLTSNQLLRRKATPYPHFYHYIATINGFFEKDKMDDYVEWEVALIDLLDVKNAPLSKISMYLEFSADLTKRNIIYNSTSALWKIKTNDFKFINDPKSEVLVVKFKNADLSCKLRNDSSLVIKNTSGIVYPITRMWIGEKGKITWKRVGFSENKVYATLRNYEINLKKHEYKADSVTFINKNYFDKELLGELHDKIRLGDTLKNARYPQFVSYNKDIEMKEVIPNVDYRGRYVQKGYHFNGEGTKLNKAHIVIKKDKQPFIKASSRLFTFDESKVESKNTYISLKIGKQDSIYHLGLRLKYLIKSEELQLMRLGKEMELSKYIDTYHGFDIDVHLMTWKRTDSIVYFKTQRGSPKEFSSFESHDFFTIDRYNNMQGKDKFHPLLALIDFIFEEQKMEFSSFEYTDYLNSKKKLLLSEYQVHQMLLRLSYGGFITYDPESRIGEKSQKLFDYYYAKRGRKDYDGIFIISELKGKYGDNAKLNLNNNILSIFSPRPTIISKPRVVMIYPDSVLHVGENRFMKFGGRIMAGLSDFYGDDFAFEYDSFRISINEADTLSFIAYSYDKNKKVQFDTVVSVFEKVTGVLQIDSFYNKSGRIKNSHYPSLTTNDTSYVYYDKLVSEKYSREKFYMENYPFTLDSLNYVTLNSVNANGMFVSGIFPDMEATLTVQEDYSLGFVRPSPGSGIDLFGGKGTFHNNVTLNSQGLGGDGEIRYLSAVVRSMDFKFYPDSVTSLAHYFVLDTITKDSVPISYDFPDVLNDSAYIFWKPNEDVLSASNKKTGFRMYNESMLFLGRIDIRPDKCNAEGSLFMSANQFNSSNYDFKRTKFSADSADMELMGKNPKVAPLVLNDMAMDVDLQKRDGLFTANVDTNTIFFYENNYKVKTDYVYWDMNSKEYSLGGEIPDYAYPDLIVDSLYKKQKLLTDPNVEHKDKIRLRGCKFASLDSLPITFNSLSAKYKAKKRILRANEAQPIEIADAIIDPTGFVDIERKGVIKKLHQASVYFPKDSIYHTFKDASINIYSKIDYKGTGTYNYFYDKENELFDKIEMDSIYVDSLQSVSIKELISTDSIHLNPEIFFYGNIRIEAQKELLNFNGGARTKKNCRDTTMLKKQWLAFKSDINPDSVMIPVEEISRDMANRKIYTGLFYTKDSTSLYSKLIASKESEGHTSIHTSKGVLYYDKKKNQYIVTDSAKIDSMYLPNNYAALYKRLCFFYGEGKINLPVDLKQFKLSTHGFYIDKIVEKQTNFDLIVGMDFYLHENAKTMISEALELNPSLEPIDITNKSIKQKIMLKIGVDETENMLNEIAMGNFDYLIPTGLNHTITFTDITMNWDTTHQSFRSYGNLGIGYFNNVKIGKYVKGYLEIKPDSKRGDHLELYFETSRNTWFYLKYQNGFLSTVSSDQDYNDLITYAKDKERILKVDKNEANYEYIITNEVFKKKFVKSFEEKTDTNILDIEDINKYNNTEENNINEEKKDNKENKEGNKTEETNENIKEENNKKNTEEKN